MSQAECGPPVIRTKLQERANEVDLALFRVYSRAADYACKDMTRTEDDRNQWQRLADGLRRVRPLVREMMHPSDREATS